MDLAGLAGTALRRVVPAPRAADLPAGRIVELPGRGTTFLVDIPGPPGAPTLILLHALACTAYLSWFPSLATLTPHYRVVMFDQRWHGRGIRSDRFSLDDCADDVAAVADLLGIDRAIVVGYSMGGLVAQLTWRRQRDRVAGLVLCASASTFRVHRRERVSLGLLNRAMPVLGGYCRDRADRIAATLPDCPPGMTAAEMQVSSWAMHEFRSTSAWAMLAAVGDIGGFDSGPWAPEIDVPTSVVVMTGDHMIPTQRQRDLAALIPTAVTFEAPGSHAGLVLGATEFVPVLAEACASVSSRLRRRRRVANG